MARTRTPNEYITTEGGTILRVGAFTAIFDTDARSTISRDKWIVRSGRIENRVGQSLFEVICQIYNLDPRGIRQCEALPYCATFTRSGLIPRFVENPNGNVANLKPRAAFDPNEMHAPMRWRSKDEICLLPITVQNGFIVHIKINKWLVRYVPKYMLHYHHRGLYLRPDLDDKWVRYRLKSWCRHGKKFIQHLCSAADLDPRGLEEVGKGLEFVYKDESFVGCTASSNRWFEHGDGTVLELKNAKEGPWRNPNGSVYIYIEDSAIPVENLETVTWAYNGVSSIHAYNKYPTLQYCILDPSLYSGNGKGTRYRKAYERALNNNDRARIVKFENAKRTMTVDRSNGRKKVNVIGKRIILDNGCFAIKYTSDGFVVGTAPRHIDRISQQ